MLSTVDYTMIILWTNNGLDAFYSKNIENEKLNELCDIQNVKIG